MGMMIVMQMQLVVDDDGDDTLASNDPCSNKDDPQCKFSPSKSILEVRIL
jgi:hypothetical protein